MTAEEIMDRRTWSHKPHPRGVHWQNCPNRMRGCFACEREQENDGSLAEQAELDKQLSAIPRGQWDWLRDYADRLQARAEEDKQQARILKALYRSMRSKQP